MMPRSNPNIYQHIPKLADSLLRRLLTRQQYDAIVGDLQEEFHSLTNYSSLKASAWLWIQIVRLLLLAIYFSVSELIRRNIMSGTEYFFERRKTFAVIGFLSSLPALLFTTASILVAYFGFRELNPILERYFFVLDSPVLLLGGLTVAFVLNTLPIVRIQIRHDFSEITGTLMLKERLRNLAVLSLSVCLLGLLLIYAFVENFKLVPTHAG